MADIDDTLSTAANAQIVTSKAPSATVVSKRAMRRKVASLDRTALSSASPVLPPVASLEQTAALASEPVPSQPVEPIAEPVTENPATPENATPENEASVKPVGRPRKLAMAAAKPMNVKTAASKAIPAKPVATKPALAKPVMAKPMIAKSVTAKAAVTKLPSMKPTAAKPVIKSAAPAVARSKQPGDHAAVSTASLRAPHISKPISNTPAPSPVFSFKDKIMDMSANFSGFQDTISQAQSKAQAAFEKSSSVLGEAGEFAKGNVEAIIASGKIFAEGVQEIGGTFAAEGRTAFESMTGDIKELAAAKSPTDFLKLQSDMVRKSFDSAVAYSSKNSETFLKLMTDAFAPLSGRVSLAVEKARQSVPLSAPVNTAI